MLLSHELFMIQQAPTSIFYKIAWKNERGFISKEQLNNEDNVEKSLDVAVKWCS